MQYLPRVKFFASLNEAGDIVPGAPVPGFNASVLSPDDYGVYYCLLEDTLSDAWEIWKYDAAADSGTRSALVESSIGYNRVFSAPKVALTCSFVAHPGAYVMNSGAASPIVKSAASTAVGYAETGTNSQNSTAISGTVRDNSPRSISIGGWAGASETVSIGFEASAENFTDNFSYATVNTGCSVVIGYRAKATAGGEVALGSANASHMSGIPVMTDSPVAGGTFVFKAVAGYDGDNYLNILSDLPGGAETYKPNSVASNPQWVFHVQGTIVARADDAANNKVVKVEWVTGGTLTQTVLTQGANNISLGLALDSMRLQATVAAVAGLKLAGYLHVTKVALPQY